MQHELFVKSECIPPQAGRQTDRKTRQPDKNVAVSQLRIYINVYMYVYVYKTYIYIYIIRIHMHIYIL